MHCWRHKTPIIYRATTQWFAGMDDVPGWHGVKPDETLRETALRGIEATQFFPAWGKARLYGMIANRPDWTLSRQRQWGVPLPFFVDKETDELHPDTLALLELAAAQGRARRHRGLVRGDATRTSASIPRSTARSPTRSTCGSIRARRTRPSWAARTAARRTRARIRSDTAFRPTSTSKARTSIAAGSIRRCSSSCMLNGVPPYKALLTHGFAVDGEGKKMSKSQGQRRRAAEGRPTRWAPRSCACGSAATDYSGELSISDEILKRVVEGYRRIRNTLRFLLANTADFDPAKDAVPVARAARDRSLRARAWRSALADGGARRLRALRVPPGRAAAADLLLGGPGRLLSRRAEGPPLHGGARRAARGARRRPRWR